MKAPTHPRSISTMKTSGPTVILFALVASTLTAFADEPNHLSNSLGNKNWDYYTRAFKWAGAGSGLRRGTMVDRKHRGISSRTEIE